MGRCWGRWWSDAAQFDLGPMDGRQAIPCLWKRLARLVSKNRLASGRKLHVNDSKLVYSTATGLKELERLRPCGALHVRGNAGRPYRPVATDEPGRVGGVAGVSVVSTRR